jgi:hypothetical protein
MSRLKKPLIILFSVLAGLFLLAMTTALILGPRIKDLVVEQINQRLSTPVKVDAIDFSFIRKFPYASVDFSGVTAGGAKVSGTNKPLLEARHVFLQFNIFDVFGDELHLKKITVEEASLVIYTDENGANNYDIFKKSNSKGGNFKLELESVDLDHVNVWVRDINGERDYSADVLKANLSGQFTEDVYELNTKGDLFVNHFRMNKTNYLDHKNTTLTLAININSKAGTYDISSSTLKVEEINLAVNGHVRNESEGVRTDLTIESKEAGLKELLSLIPGLYIEKLKDYKYSGDIYFKMQINGVSSATSTPLINASFGTSNATLSPKSSDYKLSNIRFNGTYISRISASHPVSKMSLNNLSATLEGQPLSASLTVEDFSNPYISLDAKSTINLEVLSRFYMPDTLESISGMLTVNAQIKGRSNDRSSWLSDGSVTLKDVSFKIKEKPVAFTGFNGDFSLKGSRLTVGDFRGSAAGSDFNANGVFENVYGFLLTKDEIISGQANISSRNLDLNELLEDKSQTSTTDTTYRLDFDRRLNLALNVNIGILSFRKFQAWQMRGSITLKDKVLNTSDLTFKACEGTIRMDGTMDASSNDSVLIACNADIKKIDMSQLFYQMGNFGQEIITDKNLKGKVTANIQFASTWSKTLFCNFDRIYSKSNLTIENGELVNFEPMLALSKYVKGADFKNIKFSTLKNQIEIRNQVINIPTMEIKSSAMDVTASGTHTFDNIVDYHFQLYLSQLIGKIVRDQNTEFGTIEDDGLGRMRIFINMKGPAGNPKITYDRKGIEQKIQQDIKDEKQNLKNILKQEFGWFKKDSSKVRQDQPNTQKPPKKEELQIEYDN